MPSDICHDVFFFLLALLFGADLLSEKKGAGAQHALLPILSLQA